MSVTGLQPAAPVVDRQEYSSASQPGNCAPVVSLAELCVERRLAAKFVPPGVVGFSLLFALTGVAMDAPTGVDVRDDGGGTVVDKQ